MSAQAALRSIPTLHDMAIQTGAFYDPADPAIGIHYDSYVFTADELLALVSLLGNQGVSENV